MNEDKKIKQEYNKYIRLFKTIGGHKKKLVEKLCSQLAFMTCTLDELQKIVNEEGAVIHTTNGNGFDAYSENPAQKSYNTMIKNYNATIKQLIDLLPKEDASTDELLDYIRGNT